jgi:hypothetical protein
MAFYYINVSIIAYRSSSVGWFIYNIFFTRCIIISYFYTFGSVCLQRLFLSWLKHHMCFCLFPQTCTKDRNCGATNYCHRHYGTCHKCKKIGAKCRRDHVCCKGFECVFGSCRRIVKKGNFLSRCRKDRDCKKGLCCAKSHGEFVCKPMLRENQLCSVLEGGVAYTVNHGCPCDEGLVCRRWKIRSKRWII